MAEDLYLVTGAGGFVGRHLVEHLVAQGIRVRAMVRRPDQAESLKALTDDVVIADLTKPETLAPACAGVAGIYHIAALFRQEGVAPQAFHDINVAGVQNMIDAAVAAGVGRFVHCSTNGVHSHIENPPGNEQSPFNPGDLYQETKLAGEKLAMAAFEAGQIPGIVIRPAMIYGPGDTRTLKLFRMVAKGRFFYVGPGKALNHWVDVRDLAVSFRQAMEATHVTADVFLIAGESYQSVKETADEIARQLGVAKPWLHIPVAPMMALARLFEITFKPFGIEPPLYRRRVSFFLKDRAYDITKARTVLGFKPAQDFPGEIADIIAAYRAEGKLPPGPAPAGTAKAA